MPCDVVLHRLARADIRRAASWYRRKVPGLDRDFLDCVGDAVDQISRTGDVLALAYRDLRRMHVRRFPYGLYFRIESERMVVIAVLHNRQNPQLLEER